MHATAIISGHPGTPGDAGEGRRARRKRWAPASTVVLLLIAANVVGLWRPTPDSVSAEHLDNATGESVQSRWALGIVIPPLPPPPPVAAGLERAAPIPHIGDGPTGGAGDDSKEHGLRPVVVDRTLQLSGREYANRGPFPVRVPLENGAGIPLRLHAPDVSCGCLSAGFVTSEVRLAPMDYAELEIVIDWPSQGPLRQQVWVPVSADEHDGARVVAVVRITVVGDGMELPDARLVVPGRVMLRDGRVSFSALVIARSPATPSAPSLRWVFPSAAIAVTPSDFKGWRLLSSGQDEDGVDQWTWSARVIVPQIEGISESAHTLLLLALEEMRAPEFRSTPSVQLAVESAPPMNGAPRSK